MLTIAVAAVAVCLAASRSGHRRPALRQMPPPPLPYSLSTGIAAGAGEVAGYLRSLREQGFCVVDLGLGRSVALHDCTTTHPRP